MVRMGIVIIGAALVVSMGIAMYMFTQYQPNFVTVNAGEQITVGPVQYAITFEGTHEGDEDTKPENTFLKIRIDAKNISNENTRMSGGQFFLIKEDGSKQQPIYGEFSEEDLFEDFLEPNKPVSWTTQFDVEFDEEQQYQIAIRPSKQQSSMDTGFVCITNC